MYLIENMIERGLSLKEVLELVKNEETGITEEMIIEEFKKETERVKTDENLKKMLKIIKSQSTVNAKSEKLRREYVASGGKLRDGYIYNIYMNEGIEENMYLLAFLCNRLKRTNHLGLKGYNEVFLERKTKKIKKAFQQYSEEGKDYQKEEVENFLSKDVKVNLSEKDTPATIDDEIATIKANAAAYKAKIDKKHKYR